MKRVNLVLLTLGVGVALAPGVVAAGDDGEVSPPRDHAAQETVAPISPALSAVRTALSAQLRLSRCFAAHASAVACPMEGCEVELVFDVNASGKVVNTRVLEGPLQGGPFERCVATTTKDLVLIGVGEAVHGARYPLKWLPSGRMTSLEQDVEG